MRYLGGKSREAKKILEVILRDRKTDQLYVEPFVGGCNVIAKVTGSRWGNDINQLLIGMWQAVQQGWVPPEFVSEAEYARIKADIAGDPALRAFVAIGCSWGGKWWGGYGRHKAGDPNSGLSAASARQILKIRPKLAGVLFTAKSYLDLDIPHNSLIYCDPPYAGTTGYSKTGRWDAERFWQWARFRAEHNRVFVSEFTAPADWTCVLEFRRKNDLNRKEVIEKLFTWKGTHE